MAGPAAGRVRIERFDKARHDRSAFDCGVPELNDYLRRSLNQQMKSGVAVGYVAVAETPTVLAYVTLASGRIPVTVLPEAEKRLASVRLPIPTTLIGRLAVDVTQRGVGLGKLMLVHALRVAVEQAERVASAVIEVDAKDEAAKAFYARFGFRALLDDDKHMYLPMRTARSAFGVE